MERISSLLAPIDKSINSCPCSHRHSQYIDADVPYKAAHHPPHPTGEDTVFIYFFTCFAHVQLLEYTYKLEGLHIVSPSPHVCIYRHYSARYSPVFKEKIHVISANIVTKSRKKNIKNLLFCSLLFKMENLTETNDYF